MLDLLSIRSQQAESGEQALSILETAAFDAILMDYHMPGQDGLETVRRIRQKHGFEKIPVVLLTSSSADISAALTETLNIPFKLLKPIKFNEILACLSRLAFQEESTNIIHPTEKGQVINGTFKVLIAEDNSANMFLAKTFLSRIAPAAQILEAVNGKAALEICLSGLPDIIFMDVQMPLMNGYEATGHIRKFPGALKIPIIALTAGNMKGEKERCLLAGMDHFITKPFVENTILEILRKYILPGLASGDSSPAANNVALEAHTGIDFQKLNAVYLADASFLIEFLAITMQSLEGGISDLKRYYQAKDLQGINLAGHKMKGAAASAFMPEITALAQTLEHMASFEPQEIDHTLQLLQDGLNQIRPLINDYFLS
ncbi:Sensor histidine kinase RcsC [Dyadobacter sp. CECT 9623]|uniref:Sensor histidine kinase RcsC n=2 Tax=Dyadobacter linearis TaxID=2823330 RepID=A0ABM8UYE5_9BACT|nr:Sensor histidine kinase RcsC [Dyadobacter sp. CECT 9623]